MIGTQVESSMEFPDQEEDRISAKPGYVRNMIARFTQLQALHKESQRCLKQKQEKGSEPSLASGNGHRSSVSRRTLLSHENGSSHNPHMNSSPEISGNANHSTLPDTDVHWNRTQDSPSREESTKTPSYLKISCAVSGYNRYSSYAACKEDGSGVKVVRDRPTAQINGVTNGDHVSQQNGVLDISEVKVHEGRRTVADRYQDRILRSRSRSPSSNLPSQGATETVNGRTAAVHPCDGNYVAATRRRLQQAADGTLGQQNDALNLKLDLEHADSQPETPKQQKRKDSRTTPSPSKDGPYFLRLVQTEEDKLMILVTQTEASLVETLPEEASGKIRATVGKAKLLMTQKFKQFRGLCEQNMTQSGEEPFQTTTQDLAGFWDLVSIQVEDVHAMFQEIEELRKNNWKEPEKKAERRRLGSDSEDKTTPRSSTGAKAKSPRSKDGKTTKTEKSAKAQEAAKAREEARKRLMQAKRKARQRKASQSDKEEVEIFIAA